MVDFYEMGKWLGEKVFVLKFFGFGVECSVLYLVWFLFYELDFGFGILVCFICNIMGVWDGLVFVVLSFCGEEYMLVMVNLNFDVMNNFVVMVYEFWE